MSYIGKSPSQGVRSRYYFTATGGETSLSGADDNGATLTFTDGTYVDVHLNGVLLVAGTDYNTTTANTIGGLAALSASDIVEIVVYDVFTLPDAVKASTGGTFQNSITVTGTVTADGLTVDTNTLYVDSTNNRVGVGTTSPSDLLHVYSGSSGATPSTNTRVLIEDAGNAALQILTGTTSNAQILFGDSDSAAVGRVQYEHATDDMSFYTNAGERVRIDSAGNVGIGTTSPSEVLEVAGNIKLTDATPTLRFYETDGTADENYQLRLINGVLSFQSNNDAFDAGATRLRLAQNGTVLIGTANDSPAFNNVSGVVVNSVSQTEFSTNGYIPIYVNRAQDGTLINFRSAGNNEGSISVSGTTVSYNGGHLARWSRLSDNSKDTSIVKGTVMTNLDEMVEWGDEDNEQLNKMAVSSVEGDANVAGVFVNWDEEDDWNDMNIAMTGDMVIRIAQGTTVQRGDLLMSAGDGTAKPQGDDIVRSKTIAKVTSTHVSHTYDDGSYLVPCVLMAC